MNPKEIVTIRVSLMDAVRAIDRIADVIGQWHQLDLLGSRLKWDDILCTLRMCRGLLGKVEDCIPY